MSYNQIAGGFSPPAPTPNTEEFNMSFLSIIKIVRSLILLPLIFGCASGSVKESHGPSVAEALSASATGLRARIALGMFINNTGGQEGNLQRLPARFQATDEALFKYEMEVFLPWQQKLTSWLAKCHAEGEEKAGPMPECPKFNPSDYSIREMDPLTEGIKGMLINALFNSGRFIVLERQNIEGINWEIEFSRSGRVGAKSSIPAGYIEGAELLLIGSLTTLEPEQSGGNIGAVFSSAVSMQLDNPAMQFRTAQRMTAAMLGLKLTEVDLSWKTVKTSMDLRLVDTKTSRIVAVVTVEGKATKGKGSIGKSTEASLTEGFQSGKFSVFANTPIEEAFRKMIFAAVQFLETKIPEHYHHY